MPIVRIVLRGAAAAAGLLLVLTMFSGVARAQQCWMPSTFGLQFGSVSGGGATATVTLESHCAPDYSNHVTYYYHICMYLNPGEFSTAQGPRRMYDYTSQSYLNYDVYSDPAHTVRIGAVGVDEPARAEVVVPVGSNVVIVSTVFYGLVFPGQAVPAGSYQEQGTIGLVRYRYSTAPFQASDDCQSGGMGGGSSFFASHGVTAQYENACWIVATDLDFGQVEPPKDPLYETSNIRVNCAPGTEWRVGLSDGQHFDGQTRRMAGNGGFVNYQLYLDESHTHVWADDLNENRASGVTDAAGNTASLTVYGKVPPQPEVGAGAYSDTVIATVYY